jgi:hypothetical protein
MADAFDLEAFGRAFQAFMQHVNELVPSHESKVRRLAEAHLGVEPAGLPSMSERFDPSEHPNLQLALDALAAEDDAWQTFGLPTELEHYGDFSLASMLSGRFHGPAAPCPPEYVNRPIDVDRTLPCLRFGMHLGRFEGFPIVVLVAQSGRHGPPSLVVDVVAPDHDVASRFVARLRELMHEHNVFRGKVLSFAFTEWGSFGVTFHHLPAIDRGHVVLPEADLDAIERHTVGISRHADALRTAGRHLKRGLLLYGPPGTGKTLSVMYLCGQMPGRTTLLLSGPGAGALGQATAIARALQPSMVVLEDVDLVAMERTMPGMGSNPLLFQLLNEMDGLAEDADVVFVLTTNRAELLEPALAARPGRIDQAVEIGLPDADARRRLLDLYTDGLGWDGRRAGEAVARTEGLSAAFMKELARRAALVAADRGGPVEVTGDDLVAALDDLLEHSAPVLRSALGANPDLAVDQAAGPHPGGWFNDGPGSGGIAVAFSSDDEDD